MRNVPLSVLDLATVGEGTSPRDALQATLALARTVEDLGFTRFWLAEHHNMPGIASSSPPVLMAAVAAATARIRVGSGGVMLPNHAPLVVAEQFGTLATLYPGRIDLGLGRAPGTDPRTAAALRRGPTADTFPDDLQELIGYLADGTAVPAPDPAPPIWLLGSSGYSAQVAGVLGLPFAFAHHFMARNTVPALDLYRETFRPSAALAQPYSTIAVQVVCAPTDAEAFRLARPGALSFLRLRQGRPGRLPTPAQAEAHPWTEVELELAAERQAEQAVGSPATVQARLTSLLERTGADELMVTTMVHDPADRIRSMQLVRELFGELPIGLAA